MRPSRLVACLSASLILGFAAPTFAQYQQPYPQQPYPQQPYPQQQYGTPQYGGSPQQGYGGYQAPPPQPPSTPRSTPLEIGYLYVTAATWGVGTGIWIDAEAGVEDPGLRFIAPIILGAAAPAAVFFLDRPPMPRGLPSAIATGMLIGAGEGMGISGYQYAHAKKQDEWGFTGFARAEFIGATVGGAVGGVS